MSRSIFALLILLPLLVACGGGGGGGGDAAPPPPAQPSSSAANDLLTVDEESSGSVDVASNDTNVDTSTVALDSGPTNGSVELSGSTFTYSPAVDFSGTDSFRYTVTGDDGSTLSASVSITVNDINDAPSVSDDRFTMIKDNMLSLTLGENDTDIDGQIVSYAISGDFLGEISGSGVDLVYTPPPDFAGDISFTYQATDNDGASSSSAATVIITVNPITLTSSQSFSLSMPQSGYSSVNDAELGESILASPAQTLEVPPNAVSVLLSLIGADANIDEGGLFISNLEPPSGPFPAFQRLVNFCFGGNCSSLVPRAPTVPVESGTWHFQLATRASSLDSIDFSTLSLQATIRTGPDPDLAAEKPAAFRLKPFLTAETYTPEDLAPVLEAIKVIGEINQLDIMIEPVATLPSSHFARVSADFLDTTTGQLVSQGEPDAINVFFLEDFVADENLAGISSGIPAAFGTSNSHSGLLINTSGLLGDGQDFLIQDTAEVVFHETGHMMGLYHTTEALFSNHDVLDDTPMCDPDVDDIDGDGVADVAECPDGANPMFWRTSVLIPRSTLTEGQKYVMFHAPIAVPGS